MADSLLSPQWSGSAVSELTADSTLVKLFLRIELGWLDALGAKGFTVEPQRKVLADWEVGEDLLAELTSQSWKAGNPAVGFVQAAKEMLVEQCGDPGLFHFGLTSQDVVDTSLMMMAASVFEVIVSDGLRLGASLHREMGNAGDLLCVSRTLTRSAEASLLAFRFATWLSALLDALETLERRGLELPVQMGGASGNRAQLAQLVARKDGEADRFHAVDGIISSFAANLGLQPTEMSWQTSMLPVLDLTAALAGVSHAVGQIAHNLITLGRDEIGEMRERVDSGQGLSTAMPHKSNPTRTLLAHSASFRIPGLVASIHHSAGFSDERGAGEWNAMWEPLRDLMRLTAGQIQHTAHAMEHLHVDTDKITDNLRRSGIPVVDMTPASLDVIGGQVNHVSARWNAYALGRP